MSASFAPIPKDYPISHFNMPNTEQKATILRRALHLVVIGAFGLLVLIGAHTAGRRDASADLALLQKVWPHILTMPEEDRAFLVVLSLRCQLHKNATDREGVILCLRGATASAQDMLPIGGNIDASKNLDRLLEASSPVH